MSRSLKAGVAGAGSFGRHHARIYAGIEGVILAAVFDPDLGRARAIAEAHGGVATDDLAAFLAACDVITVASPATTHAATALAALRASKPIYVEKPIATSLDDADALVAAADRAGVVLACGHQERVASRAMGLLDIPERPTFLEAVRLGPWSPRNADVSCVLDLMIHDIDLALALNPSEPLAVEAEGITDPGPLLDEVRAEITLSDGCGLKLKASRIAPVRERRMRIVFPSGEVEVDFITRSFRNTTPFKLNADYADTAAGKDPLGASVAAFVAAVRGDAPRPAVNGVEAARALDLALAVEMAAGG